MSDDGWITEPEALDTLVALGGLQKGDEIIYYRCPGTASFHHGGLKSGEIYVLDHGYADHYGRVTERVKAIPYKAGWAGGTPIVPDAGGYYLARANIAAWRRPIG